MHTVRPRDSVNPDAIDRIEVLHNGNIVTIHLFYILLVTIVALITVNNHQIALHNGTIIRRDIPDIVVTTHHTITINQRNISTIREFMFLPNV